MCSSSGRVQSGPCIYWRHVYGFHKDRSAEDKRYGKTKCTRAPKCPMFELPEDRRGRAGQSWDRSDRAPKCWRTEITAIRTLRCRYGPGMDEIFLSLVICLSMHLGRRHFTDEEERLHLETRVLAEDVRLRVVHVVPVSPPVGGVTLNEATVKLIDYYSNAGK